MFKTIDADAKHGPKLDEFERFLDRKSQKNNPGKENQSDNHLPQHKQPFEENFAKDFALMKNKLL